MRNSTNEREAWRLEERRKEARYTLILRAGVLEQGEKSSFCLVKNISTTGVQLKIYTRPVLHSNATLRVADEQPVTGRISWINDDYAGMSLDEELDAATLLRVQQKLRSNKRRALPRMSVEESVLLRTGGRVVRGSVRDISSLGMRVIADAKLEAGARTMLELAGLPSISAYVRWTEGDEAGLAFETPIPIQIIAHWTEGRGRISC